MKKLIILVMGILFLTACGKGYKSYSLMQGLEKTELTPATLNAKENSKKTEEVFDFSIRLFEEIYAEENTLISPLSIVSALSMTANAANAETLAQMESVLGGDRKTTNEFLHAYTSSLPTSKKYKFNLANSIWTNKNMNFEVNQNFLQTTQDYYAADVFELPFDEKTKDIINSWVKANTDKQIDELLTENPNGQTLMYLINALSFDAEWKNIYKESDIREGIFTLEDGTEKTTDFMSSNEYHYIELPNAKGFSKPYVDEKYSLVALLPDERLTLEDFMKSLEGKPLLEAIKNSSEENVDVKIPKFSFEYGNELSEALINLGMPDAFDENKADFSLLGKADGNIYIQKVLHKAKISVDEKGTKAGAATSVQMGVTSAFLEEEKTVHLDRPFLFMIVDNELSFPIFMGVLNDVED